MRRSTIDDYRPATSDADLPLFAPAQAHSATSRAAAARQTPAKAGTDRARILAALEAGPLTDEQIADTTGIEANTVRPRRGELVRDGLVVRVDDEGRTRTGSRATRWGRKTT